MVDAIAWVLGEQGAKALRGGKMEDVIFAGTADRPPLGRAEVTLTIDNSDGALPIDYAEVSITRRMFRDGVGEYEINGSSCRLLDIQELLSDSGIGREMHVIVGQGQLDAVLSGPPGGPAGVRRGGRRRAQAPQAPGEDGPQARRHAGQPQPADRPDRRDPPPARPAGPAGRGRPPGRRGAGRPAGRQDAFAGRRSRPDHAKIAQEAVDEQAAVDHRTRVQAALAAGHPTARRRAEAMLREATPALQQAQDTWFALSALAERMRGTIALAGERARNLAAPARDAATGRDPDELEAAAERAEAEQEALQETRRGRRRRS